MPENIKKKKDTDKRYIRKYSSKHGDYMKRINVMVSDEAKNKILEFQKQNNIPSLDETLDKYILTIEANKL
jgi:hypothetical protein